MSETTEALWVRRAGKGSIAGARGAQQVRQAVQIDITSAAVAALLAGRIPLADGPVVAILSGGNVDLDRLPGLLGAPGASD